MKMFKKSVLSILVLSVVATSAFASSDDSPREELRSAKARVAAITLTLEKMGENVDSSVDLNGAYTYRQKTLAYLEKRRELQGVFNELHFK